jgi:hypothetical protein
MNPLMEMIMGAAGGGAVQQLGQQFGLSQEQTTGALGQLIPALLGGVKNNTQQEGGMEALLGALSGGNHGRFLEDPSLIGQAETTSEGNSILGHLLGSKEASRAVASHASAQTGIGADILKQMLPVVATMVMGGLSKQNSSAMSAAPGLGGGMAGNLLSAFLDKNHNGTMVDDVVGMLGNFFRK